MGHRKFLYGFLFFCGSVNIVLAQVPTLVLPVGHTGEINDVAFSPDSKYVVTGSEDGTAKLWEAKSGYLLRDLKSYSLWLDKVQFSPDGQYILTVSNDNTAKIWLTRSGQLLHTLKGKTPIGKLGNGGIWIDGAFSPDGQYVVTVSNADLDNKLAQVWETRTGRLFRTFPSSNELLVPPAFSADSKYISLSSGKNSLVQWEISSGKAVNSSKYYSADNDSAFYSPDRNYLLSIEKNTEKNYSLTTRVCIRSAKKGEVLTILADTNSYTNKARFSPDGRMLITGNDKQEAIIWEIPSGRLLSILKGRTNPPYEMLFSRDGKYIVSQSEDSIQLIWDLTTGQPSKQEPGAMSTVYSDYKRWDGDGETIITTWDDSLSKTIRRKGPLAKAFFDVAELSRDGKYVVTAEGTWDNVARIWDASTGQLLRTLKGHTGVVSSAEFSRDGKMVLTSAFDDTARIWETSTGRLLKKLDGHQAGVRSADFSPDDRYVVTTCRDNSINLWDTRSARLRYTFFSIDSSDYFGIIPAGYYQGSRDAAKLLHYVTPSLQVITFEQLDVKFNRPDKVLESIGSTDTALIRSYHKAWEKRIRKLGIDTTSFRDGYSVPDCDFTDRDNIEYEQKTGTLKLRIRGIDSTYKLDRFNVWINEAPVYGQRGISLKKKNQNSLDTTITVVLSEGENRIETSITNVNGTESYRMPLIVNYTPAVKQSVTTYFIGIGIDKFKDSKNDLQYSSKDIRDLSSKLKEKYGNSIVIDTLFNENVNISNVKALKERLKQTTVNDKVIIAYSGHGLLSRDFDYYLSTYAVNFQKPEENGLPYDELENLLDSIPARKKLMLIDACHSGEVDKEELVRINKASDSMHLTKGGITIAYETDGKLGMKNSFELMQNLFVNVGKSTGATIISAAAGTQFALERGDLKNGVFTYSILEAMDKYPTLKISELKKIVGKRVEQLTNGLQKPTSRNENIAVDWALW